MYPTQNVNNDPTVNIGYHKLIIEKGSLQQNGDSLQSQPNYPIVQQVQQPIYQPQYQQPYPPPYQQPPLQPYQQVVQQPYFQFQQPFSQQQQPIINPQNIQLTPNIEQLNNYDHLKNQGQNRRFGLCIAFIWTISLFLDFYLVYIGLTNTIPQELGILCIIVMYLITLAAFIINKKQASVLSFVLFLIFILSNLGASIGFIELFGRQAYVFYLIFEFYQLVTMASAFLYLIATQSIPEARFILRITTVSLVITSICYILAVMSYIKAEQFITQLSSHIVIWFFCCGLQSQIFIKILNQVYAGQHKKISKHNIWAGFIMFKLHFYIPWLKN